MSVLKSHFELLNFANDYFGQQDMKSQVAIKTLHGTSIFNKKINQLPIFCPTCPYKVSLFSHRTKLKVA
jgi:hypothetical protein